MPAAILHSRFHLLLNSLLLPFYLSSKTSLLVRVSFPPIVSISILAIFVAATMINKGKGKKGPSGTITEENISHVLERYTPNTVLILLQEVALVAAANDGKIDWNGLVKKTFTGITSAREYQMLWRHLAYRHYLADDFDKGAETPLVDDSDTEYELEARPAVSNEASVEAAAYVKVHIDSGLLNDPSLSTNSNYVQAPLTINIPYKQSFSARLDESQTHYTQGKNIIVPVCVPKQQTHAPAPAKGVNVKSSPGVNTPSHKKRKTTTATESKECVVTLLKRGEGNSAASKVDFKGEKSHAQPWQAESMQRWTDIKQSLEGPTKQSFEGPTKAAAVRNAVSAAINLPVGNFRSAGTGGTSSNIVLSNSSPPDSEVGINNPHQPQSTIAPISRTKVSFSVAKSRITSKKPPTKPPLTQSSIVKDAAVAAGARIASPEDAASHLMAAKSNNVIHIMTGSGSMIKSSTSCSTPSIHFGAQHNKNTGVSAAPPSPDSTATPSAPRPTPGKPANLLSEHTSNANIESSSKQVAKVFGQRKVINSSIAMIKQVQNDQTSLTSSSKAHQVKELLVQKQVEKYQQCGLSNAPKTPINPEEDQITEIENVNNVKIMDVDANGSGDHQFESKEHVVPNGASYQVPAASKQVV